LNETAALTAEAPANNQKF